MNAQIASLDEARRRKSGSSETPLLIAEGKKDLGKVKNKKLFWPQIVEKITTPLHVETTFERYKEWADQGQTGSKKRLELKMQAGYIFGGHCRDGVRKKENVEFHSFILLDLDKLDVETFWEIEGGMPALEGMRYAWHTTIGHSPEKPRVRIAIPLTREINDAEFQAISRTMAKRIDPDMTQVDLVSFRLAQMMFLPVVCKNAKFAAGHADGFTIDPDAWLKSLDFDWKNIALLPRCPEESRDELTRANAGKKPVHPEEKQGLVGDFCRMWDVPAAMDEFIPGVYERDDNSDNRFTYTRGHGHSGAVVYDDGAFLFSNHGSDPCSDQNVNAFDMVRLHLFGGMDKSGADGTESYDSPAKRPSYKALADKLAEDYPEFSKFRAAGRYLEADEAQDRFADLSEDDDEDPLYPGESESTEVASKEVEVDELGYPIEPKELAGVTSGGVPDWLEKLNVSKDGIIQVTPANVLKILLYHPRYAGTLEYSEFTGRIHTRKQPETVMSLANSQWDVWDKLNGVRFESHHRHILIRDFSESGSSKKSKRTKTGLNLRVPVDLMKGCIEDAARYQPYHPVREYLQSGEWDRKRRAETIFIDWLGAEDTPYHREVARLVLLAAVTRVMEPGTKFDYMPVLESRQGIGKSFWIEALGKSCWAGALKIDFDDERKIVESTSGKWIMEFPELKGMRGDRIEEMKHFLTETVDRVRLAYREDEGDFARQWIVFGTTNEDAYLYDTTGNRRMLPVRCSDDDVDIEGFKRVVDQVWYEAYFWYQCEQIDRRPGASMPLWITDVEIKKVAKELQESRHIRVQDSWLTVIEDWLDTPVPWGMRDGRHDGDPAPKDDVDEFGSASNDLANRDLTCIQEIAVHALKIDLHKITRADQLRIADLVKSTGKWKASRKNKRFQSPSGVHKAIYRIGGSSDPDAK